KSDVTTKYPKARVEVGDLHPCQVRRQLPNEPFGWPTKELDRSLLAAAGTHHLVPAVHLVDEGRNLVVGIGHVDVGPDHECAPGGHRPVLAGRAGPPVLTEPEQSDAV